MKRLAGTCRRLFPGLGLVALLLAAVPAWAGTAPSDPPLPVYRLPLRVHLGGSGRPVADFRAIFAEINRIWLSQAGICFEIKAVPDGREPKLALDMWFHPVISGMRGLNGYYDGEDIQMRDHPVLKPAPHPSPDGAGRTAAHELGHALGLHHDQSNPDNLMASKTYGWHLHPAEIATARRAAAEIALPDPGRATCGPPIFIGFGKVEKGSRKPGG